MRGELMKSNPILDLEDALGRSAQDVITSRFPLLRDAHGPVYVVGFIETSEGKDDVGLALVVKRTSASVVCWSCDLAVLDPIGCKS